MSPPKNVLFSADGFGRFGAVAKFDEKADWASEARRYYLNTWASTARRCRLC